jgi:uncharacterized membrane protein YidH (DUF202 family)
MSATQEPGRATERTALAWQRTALALLASALLLARLTYDRIGVAALACLVVAVPAALWVMFVSGRRYVDHTTSRRAPGGRSAVAVTALTLLLAVIELSAIHAR